ncbi:MAG TPA: hypothetical protein VF552_12950 [Allosphingosinicella sp.]|jgi:hypothetical protein
MTKDKKMKVPKRIAGVKVPKKIRKPVNKALAIAENPATRDLAVAALTAAAAALARKGAESAAGTRAQGDPVRSENGTGNLTDVIIAAALDGARRLLDTPAAADTDAAAADADVIDAPVALEATPPAQRTRRRTGPASGPAGPAALRDA